MKINFVALVVFLKCFSASFSQIRITEIMHDPVTIGGKVLAEYVELYNDSSEKILISDWVIKDATDKSIATIKTPSTFILPKSYFVVTNDTSIYKKFPELRDSINIYITGIGFLGLNLDSDKVVVYDKQGIMQDSVQYFNSWHRKDLSVTKGISLEKISPNSNGNFGNNWSSSAATQGGTPARKNSVSSEVGSSDKIFSALPLTFSPDKDGIDELLHLNYNLPLGNYRANIKVYDKHGREVKIIANDLPISATGEQIWDGTTEAGSIANIGVYILRFEYYQDSGGGLRSEQITVVLAKKF